MGRMLADKALGRCQRLGLVQRLVVQVGDFHLRLGRVAAKWIVGFEALPQLQCGIVLARIHFATRFIV
jgi:hypothetical protein